MDVRHATSPDAIPLMDTSALRSRFLVTDLVTDATVRLTYSHEERIVLGGVVPADAPVELPNPEFLRSEYFTERREIGVVNVGSAPGTVTVDGAEYPLDPKECLYVGRGSRQVTFGGGAGAAGQAAYYLISTAAHASFPTRKATLAEAEPVHLGSTAGSNERTIYKFIHAKGIESSQLVLGVTVLEPGSMWNTMPCHTHERRTEVYFYFDLPAEHRVVHLLGEPQETRNLIVADRQAVVSPRWSVHCGVGTASYAFVWAMGGENQAYDDMDVVAIPALR